MASRNTVRLPWDALERNRESVEKMFPGIVLPDTTSIKKILSSSSPKFADHTPGTVPEYERQSSKMKRYGITGADLLAREKSNGGSNVPSIASVLNNVPTARNITSINQLRSDHRVFYNVGDGTVHCVVTQKDVKALTFYRRYYMNTPQIAEVRGDVFRKNAHRKHNMLTCDGVGIKWLTPLRMGTFLSHSFSPQTGREYDIVKNVEATFAPLVNERPVLDHARVRFVFVRYYHNEKLSASAE